MRHPHLGPRTKGNQSVEKPHFLTNGKSIDCWLYLIFRGEPGEPPDISHSLPILLVG